MITIFEIGSDFYWTGNRREIAEDAGCPKGWTRAIVPEAITEGQYAKWEGKWVIADPPAPPVPAAISYGQFFRALWKLEKITFDECRAAVKTGDLPAGMAAMVEMLPEEQRQDALLIIESASEFRRAHTLTIAFSAMYGMTEDQTDDLWRLGASL